MTQSKKTKTKKIRPKKTKKIRLQGYFTRTELARRIADFILWHLEGDPLQSIIDPSGGTGHLLQGFHKALGPRNLPKLHMVEPVAPDPSERPYRTIKPWVGLFDMTLEEWCLTYAAPQSYDLWLANPPFNKRLGDTKLGEPCQPLFRPELTYFESLFLLTGSVVVSRYMALILPDRYFRKSEARPTLQKLALGGWDLLDVRALPLDGCQNALENMSFLFFQRRGPVGDWVDAAMDLIPRHAAPPLFKGRPTITETGIHGPKTGYLLRGASTDPFCETGLDRALHFKAQTRFAPTEDTTPFDWSPQPKALGALWLRQGWMYELGETGWELANQAGYCDGQPVNPAFDQARQAYRLIQKGAFYAANRILEGLDLDPLREQFKDIHAASFLTLIAKGAVIDGGFGEDIKRLGMLAIEPDEEPEPIEAEDIVRIQGHLVCRTTLSEVQACELFVTYAERPDWLTDMVTQLLHGQHIPTDQLSLRTPWIPRALIAQYLELRLDPRGLYLGEPKNLIRYLNYGKDGQIIKDEDREFFEVESNRFAVAVNHWDAEQHAALRLRIHAHYRVAHAPLRQVLAAYEPVEAANGRQLHPWQRDDLDFYLSGATLSNLDVGVGKTLTALAASIAYTKGSNRKALIAVPKQVLMKWGRELEQFFPGIGHHILGFYQSKTGKTLRRPGAKIVEEARAVFWDPTVSIILTSLQVIGDFKLRPDEQRAADIQNGYDQLGVPANPKQALRNAAFVQKSAERNYRNGGELTWSDLPADLLVVIDEAHNYKNLFGMPSQGWGQSFIMAGSASESKRARDLQIKLDLVRQRGGKTLGLTATLVSNSVAEIYNMLRVFAPQALAKRGITNTQHVIDHFCIIEPILSVSLGGQAREGHTIVGFKNLDILRAIWRETTRTYTAADVGLKIPERVEIRELIPPTPEISAYMETWKDCLEDLIDRGPKALSDDSEEPTLFEIISLLDKVAAHPPLVGIEGEHPKLDRLAANVQKIYRSPRHPGQQIVFADMKAVQNGIQARLIQDGIPAEEIVVVNADTAPEPDQRLAIQDRFNRGAFRIIIGGKVISEGIDLQANTHYGEKKVMESEFSGSLYNHCFLMNSHHIKYGT